MSDEKGANYHNGVWLCPPNAKFYLGTKETEHGLRVMEVRGDLTSARANYWRVDMGWNSIESITLSEDEMRALVALWIALASNEIGKLLDLTAAP